MQVQMYRYGYNFLSALLRFPEHDLLIFGMAFIFGGKERLRISRQLFGAAHKDITKQNYNSIYSKSRAKSLNLSGSRCETTQKLCQTFYKSAKLMEQNNTKMGANKRGSV